MGSSFSEMNAICQGVQKRYESALALRAVITKETVEIARRLGVPSEDIQKWVETTSSESARRFFPGPGRTRT